MTTLPSGYIVLGVGSSFADDKAGWMVAQELINQCPDKIEQGRLVVELLNRPGLNLLAWLTEQDIQLILVDMVKTNLSAPGKIFKLCGTEIVGFSGMLSSHSLGVSASLELAQVLGMNIGNVIFFGIEGIYSTPGDDMCAEVKYAVNQTITQIMQILDKG